VKISSELPLGQRVILVQKGHLILPSKILFYNQRKKTKTKNKYNKSNEKKVRRENDPPLHRINTCDGSNPKVWLHVGHGRGFQNKRCKEFARLFATVVMS
jgi:hypothetical protein